MGAGCLSLLVTVACEQSKRPPEQRAPSATASASAALGTTPGAAATLPERTSFGPKLHGYSRAPSEPSSIGAGRRPCVVLITAEWCQYCQLLEHAVLPQRDVRRRLDAEWDFFLADADRAPSWLDVPGLQGLPSLYFCDTRGRHVLTRSGYRSEGELTDLLDAMKKRIEGGGAEPYAPAAPLPQLPAEPITREQARKALKRFESQVFIKVNSNDGGFGTPARHPHPSLLHELQLYSKVAAPPRVEQWVARTVESALRGRSPRLDGKPLPDFPHSDQELQQLAGLSGGSPKWRSGVSGLPAADPFQGLQDPIDHGVFRYAAGPGWYHPHFERRALDNLAWVMLLRARGRNVEASQVAGFVERTFLRGKAYAAVQRSQPFYYRLRASERSRVEAPAVVAVFPLEAQARAARVNPARCSALSTARNERWPAGFWTGEGSEQTGQSAAVDAVGELLLALAACGQTGAHGKLAKLVEERWQQGTLPPTLRGTRLFRLAAGLCATARLDALCRRALGAVTELPLDLDYPPPLHALARASQ